MNNLYVLSSALCLLLECVRFQRCGKNLFLNFGKHCRKIIVKIFVVMRQRMDSCCESLNFLIMSRILLLL
uniref:Secreted protein n=1 Tax=Anguilla anguilla TaxID=7936 RepID=A0A0E9WP44_ANGAN